METHTPYETQLNTLEFKAVVSDLIQHVDEVIETGTFHGNGSTKVFAETGKYVFSIECNYDNFVIASNNLRQFENVCVLHALSLPKQKLIKILLNESFSIDTTYDSKFPKPFYMREINQFVSIENALELFCENHRKQLIFLDSAGGVGYAEYQWVMSLPDHIKETKILLLDDIKHIKHCRSVADLMIQGYDVHISEDERFAWVDLSTKPTINKIAYNTD